MINNLASARVKHANPWPISIVCRPIAGLASRGRAKEEEEEEARKAGRAGFFLQGRRSDCVALGCSLVDVIIITRAKVTTAAPNSGLAESAAVDAEDARWSIAGRSHTRTGGRGWMEQIDQS